ncbi:peptide ABC transporter ATPase [Lysinibacillus sp. BF-4]|uniref:ABC transporter ATP-binding protein n=1 Tax=Lysinibacillus sp. BF-4 TaxID=1473546 RepID=UPI000507EBD4|nr:ABC transporter ATP-binding protein [Lysinibacillus sp. BF-4]KFL44267.1 peptide ABC transporter ATPase [Lysinibacillus sp. BF-4]
MNKADILLDIKNLTTSFRIKDDYFAAVDDVTLTLRKNEVLAIVGESGCGKSTLATSIVGLHNPDDTKTEGEIIYHKKNLVAMTDEQFNNVRGAEIGFIFQDPLSALNPLMRIEQQIEESLIYHTKLNKDARHKRVIELLEQVGIPNPQRTAKQFPHQLSGGMRQRVMIAIALSCKPAVIIADEPTTALDVTIQAQILDLLKELQTETEAGIILITHDLGVVAEIADRVAVMYAGQVIEEAPVNELFTNPKHPYTRSLLNSIPQMNVEGEKLNVIHGIVPSLKNLPRTGCRFSTRVPWLDTSSHEQEPRMHEVAPDHYVRCTCWQTFRFEEESDVV